MHHELIIY